jgi:hypothetical protein
MSNSNDDFYRLSEASVKYLLKKLRKEKAFKERLREISKIHPEYQYELSLQIYDLGEQLSDLVNPIKKGVATASQRPKIKK